jgi:hypothetical protein
LIREGSERRIFNFCRRLVRAFDVFALGTAIVITSLLYKIKSFFNLAKGAGNVKTDQDGFSLCVKIMF